MIAFIERGMKIPIGRVTRDYLIAHRLSPIQCTPNMFRILGSVDALNERMNVNLTHHDVNQVYNRHKLTCQGYYLKTRVPVVRLISCLPQSNKVMDKDFLVAQWTSLLDPRKDTKWGVQVQVYYFNNIHFLTNIFHIYLFYCHLQLVSHSICVVS